MVVPINRAMLGQHRFASFDVNQVDGRLAGVDSLFGDQFVHLLVIQLGLSSTPFEFQAATWISLHIAPGAGRKKGIGLILREVEVAGKARTDTHQRHPAGEVNILPAIGGTVQKRMPVRVERRFFRERRSVAELLPLVVKLHQAALVYRQGRLDFYVLRQQPGLPVFVRQHHEAIDPGRPLARHFGGFLGKAIFAEGVGEINTEAGIESALAGE